MTLLAQNKLRDVAKKLILLSKSVLFSCEGLVSMDIMNQCRDNSA